MQRTTPDPERRLARSNDVLISLSRLLEATRRDSQLSAVAVADTSGCVVAGAGARPVVEELAALAALSASEPAGAPSARRPLVRRLQVDGSELLISALGGGSEHDYRRISEGCTRILDRRTA